jgi:NAD(P)-dependent dehydrogenase (short-subunit alcohol dehydrogenase family)
MTPVSPVAVVTGANSGIGRATAIHLAAQGYDAYGTVRSKDRATKLAAMSAERGVVVKLVELDVVDDASVRRGFDEILERAGHIEVLVNNAGVGGNGVTEAFVAATHASWMFGRRNVPPFGPTNITRPFRPGSENSRTWLPSSSTIGPGSVTVLRLSRFGGPSASLP